VGWYQRKLVFVPLLIIFTLLFVLYKSCNKDGRTKLLHNTKEEVRLLQLHIAKLENQIKLQKSPKPKESFQADNNINNNNNNNNNNNDIPRIYFITPTYTRHTQQADLIRLSQTLKHVDNLQWVVVEDSPRNTSLVANILKSSGLRYTHLYIETQGKLVRKKNEQRWKRHRGVDQRNEALRWIRQHVKDGSEGVVYFGDDDNTYHLDIFSEMRSTKGVSMWPVALVGGLRYEGPICAEGHVKEFFTAWMPQRQFPVDMAAFAINLRVLFEHPTAAINPDVARGFLETDFLQQLDVKMEQIEAKGNDCKKILVWHTQTAEANMKEEVKLKQSGKPGSDPTIMI